VGDWFLFGCRYSKAIVVLGFGWFTKTEPLFGAFVVGRRGVWRCGELVQDGFGRWRRGSFK
jgi:hypothetical protein